MYRRRDRRYWNRRRAVSGVENNTLSKQSHSLANYCYIDNQTETDLRVIIKSSLKTSNISLISGFIRILYAYNEEKFNKIPNDICRMIYIFCCKVDRFVYGIGSNTYGCFGVANNRSDIKTWKLLQQLSALCYGSYYKISCGYQRLLIQTQSNKAYVAGYNKYGATLYIHDNTFKTTSITRFQYINDKLTPNEDILVTSNGTYAQHSFVVDIHNSIYAFGCNTHGQHGRNTFDQEKGKDNWNKINHFIPYKIDNAFCNNVCIKQIECGGNHTLFLLENGKLFCCGSNRCGQSGLDNIYNNDKQLILVPTEIPLNDFIIDIKCGAAHNLCLSESKKVYVFGKNTERISGNIQILNTPTLCDCFKAKQIRIIGCGENHSFCIDDDNWCYIFGSNCYGQIGNGEGGKSWDFVDIPYKFKYKVMDGSAANHTVLISATSKSIYTFGHNNCNQCGIGGEIECHDPRNIKLRNFDERYNIVKVVAGYQSTLVVIE